MKDLPDMQKSTEGFVKMPINKVGMRNVEVPFKYYHPDMKKAVETKGTFSSYCNLVEDVKGINMSRISRSIISVVEGFDVNKKKGLFDLMKDLVEELSTAHGATDIYAKVKFDYPLYRTSPETKLSSPEYINLTLESIYRSKKLENFVTIERVGMSLCPCSKDMSLLMNNMDDSEMVSFLSATLPASLKEKIMKAGFGAHNQRSHVHIKMAVNSNFAVEDIIEAVDSSYSCTVKTVLKRPDEKYETEVSYLGGYYQQTAVGNVFKEVPGTGPKFVEDIARDIADKLNKNFLDKTISDYAISVLNSESIHSNDIEAVAVLTAGRYLN